MTRRTAVAKAASALPFLAAMPAFAELKRAEDAEIYARADAGKLNAARAIERAKAGDLVDGSSATCAELDALIGVDREAIEFEKDKVEASSAWLLLSRGCRDICRLRPRALPPILTCSIN